jgi:uncharacterized protein HemX
MLDLVDVAVNVQQSRRIGQTREQLARMEQGMLQEAERRQFIELLRNIVFTVGQNIRALEQRVEAMPQPCYVTAKALAWRLQEYGIAPEIFPEFADKEYVQQVREKIDVITQRSRSMLNDAQVMQADACVHAIVEMPALDQTIDEVRTAVADLQHVEAARSRQNLYVGLGIALIVVAMATALLFLPLMFILLLLGIGLVGFGIYQGSDLEEQRQALQAKVQNGAQAAKQFEGIPDLQQMRRERQQLIQQVMGQVEGYEKLLVGPAGAGG